MTPSSFAEERQRGQRRVMPLQLLIGFVLAALATATMALFTYQSQVQRSEAVEKMNAAVETISQLQAVLNTMKNAETGQRGYLLTGEDRYLEPFNTAAMALGQELQRLAVLTQDRPLQVRRFDQLKRLTSQKMQELEDTIALQRAGKRDEAVALVRSDLGLLSMDNIRNVLREMLMAERQELESRRKAWEEAASFAAYLMWGSSVVLLLLIGGSAAMTAADHRSKARENWIKSGLVGLGGRLQGDHRLQDLGPMALEYLAGWLGAKIGAVYVTEGHGLYQRMGGYALPDGSARGQIVKGEGLVGQAAQSRQLLHVQDVPKDYLPVVSGTGSSAPAEIVLVPTVHNGVAHAVIELGFFRKVNASDLDFLSRASEQLALAIRSAIDRTKLEALLEETQRQAEELQAQQEELRVSNEELEQQSRMLQESQAQMEAQQTELEQSNAQLEEQTQQLEYQKQQLLRAQDALTGKARDLELASQYKSEFLANMSHELRTPLNSSLILAKLLADNKQGNLSPDQVKYAQTIHAAGNDLLTLINDILDLAKIEAGQATMSIEEISLQKAVQAVADPLRALAEDKHLTFSAVVEPGAPARIESDPQRLAQILKNLLSNAIKFTDQGEVTLRVSANADGTVSFAVHDTGIGIEEHQRELIFEAFRQADGSTHRKYGGTGLGLSISRDLAQRLGGDITVQSTPGQGSVFTLILPAAAPRQSEASAAASTEATATARPTARAMASPTLAPAAPAPVPALAAAEPAAVPQRRVPGAVPDDRDALQPGKRVMLVVEDDVRFARILYDLAREMDFQCIVTHTGGEGLAAALEYMPSAVVLDMNLPDFSGLGVLDQLKRNPATRHIPVHVVSVADYAQEALGRGAIGYALKPVKREELVHALERMEAKFTQSMRRVLVVEDDDRQRESVGHLLANGDVEIVGAETAQRALELLRSTTFDCMVMDLNLPDLSGYELLEQMAEQEDVAFPPVIVYTGRSLSRDEEQQLRRFSKSIIIKDARSPERLLDEVTLFLHQVESTLPMERRKMLQAARDRDSTFDGRTILVVEDDVRNVFALSSVLEPTGARVEIARNGREALEALERAASPGAAAVDLVLMDIMMPEMDGFTAMKEIRKRSEWRRLPIIALTAKAMKDDQEKCLAAGANDYIAKPLDVEKLLSLVRVWMPK
ncbi:response regulator [Paracidovorax wautersii]|uniref:histidine kinase n=1 Tax=Paracidovorax wautersii TaxID=1177982 RepID=A0ABU1IC41_9BURK|nr:response regulator [Paracidovorax wautersii]MDR6214352.1 signal transduction histidine kinase/DNA-binding response OmpR family regulator/CHASE3 domain sensor protein [Paracidovorax wautersii]